MVKNKPNTLHLIENHLELEWYFPKDLSRKMQTSSSEFSRGRLHWSGLESQPNASKRLLGPLTPFPFSEVTPSG